MIKGALIFLIGFLSCALLFVGLYIPSLEVPPVTGLVSLNLTSPSDWIAEEDIMLFNDMIILYVDNATISNYASTGSMKPFFDKGANGIRVVPRSSDELSVGDIVSFEREGNMIVHRIVEKGFDEGGVYFVTQGDNSFSKDSKIRFEDIKFVTIGVLW